MVEQDDDFGPTVTRCGDGKTAILLFADCKLGLAGYKGIRFVREAICRLKQLKNQR